MVIQSNVALNRLYARVYRKDMFKMTPETAKNSLLTVRNGPHSTSHNI